MIFVSLSSIFSLVFAVLTSKSAEKDQVGSKILIKQTRQSLFFVAEYIVPLLAFFVSL